MIAAGSLKKSIIIQVLVESDGSYGDRDEDWETIIKTRAKVLGFDRDSYLTLNAENLVTDRLQFNCRDYINKIFDKEPTKYRIIYNCKAYRILNINKEYTGECRILTEIFNT